MRPSPVTIMREEARDMGPERREDVGAGTAMDEERAVMALRSLYERHGYSCYRMSKFEEYDIYARHRDFLPSGDIIAFTDADGKLMALKPDVTLSVVRHVRDDGSIVRKVFYDESVYRVPRGARTFREIRQVGLEQIGPIDAWCVCEALCLAAWSLDRIRMGHESALDVAHLGIVASMLDALGVEGERRRSVLRCFGEKNAHGLAEACAGVDAPQEEIAALRRLASVSAPPREALGELRAILARGPKAAMAAVGELEDVLEGVEALDADALGQVRVDLSVMNDLDYYNGIVFRGFIEGIPAGVLSGGQYDRLAREMGRAGAVGFAVNLDQIERLGEREKDVDVDVLLLYGPGDEPRTVASRVRELTRGGRSVMAQRAVPEGLRSREIVRMGGGEGRA